MWMVAALGSEHPIPHRRRWLVQGGLALAGTWIAGSRQAQAQASEPLKLATCLPLSGEWAAQGRAVALGAQAALAGAQVNGRPLALQVVDDAGRPEDALKRVQSLAADARVLGLLGLWGAEANEAVLPLLEPARLPLVGPMTGSERLRSQASRWCFPLRAGVSDEAARMLNQLDHQSLNDLALVHTDDAFGLDTLAALQLEINRVVMRPVSVSVLAQDSQNLDSVLATVAASKPHAVIVAAPTRPAATFIKRWVLQKGRASIGVLADTGRGLPALLGEAGHGVAVSQVLPSPWRPTGPMVRGYQAAMRAADPGQVDPRKLFGYDSLEGYINALTALKALQRSGRGSPSREALLAGLEGLELEGDGLNIKMGRSPRRGSRFGEITVLTADGLFRR